MREPRFLFSLVTRLAVSPAGAETLYVTPTGTEAGDCATRAAPCSLAAAASAAAAGDMVVLMDGIYREAPYAVNSGTSEAWITFEADERATRLDEQCRLHRLHDAP